MRYHNIILLFCQLSFKIQTPNVQHTIKLSTPRELLTVMKLQKKMISPFNPSHTNENRITQRELNCFKGILFYILKRGGSIKQLKNIFKTFVYKKNHVLIFFNVVLIC
jgi:hypothetical protein